AVPAAVRALDVERIVGAEAEGLRLCGGAWALRRGRAGSDGDGDAFRRGQRLVEGEGQPAAGRGLGGARGGHLVGGQLARARHVRADLALAGDDRHVLRDRGGIDLLVEGEEDDRVERLWALDGRVRLQHGRRGLEG